MVLPEKRQGTRGSLRKGEFYQQSDCKGNDRRTRWKGGETIMQLGGQGGGKPMNRPLQGAPHSVSKRGEGEGTHVTYTAIIGVYNY